MDVVEGACGTHPAWWVPRENSFFRETLGESAPGLPRIGVFGGPAALRRQRPGPRPRGVTHGCCQEGPCGYPAG